MPDEWGYPSSSMPHVSSALFSRMHRITHNILALTDMPRNIRGAAAPTIPTCRYLNCHRPVTTDEITHEFTEYCSPEHMRFVIVVCRAHPVRALGAELNPSGLPSDAVQRLGYPVCPACNRCPRRSDSMFCGSLCDEWAMQQQQQQQHQHQQQLQSQQRQQQEHYQRHQEQRQHWQSPTMGPPPTVPNPSAVNPARGSAFLKKGIRKQVRFQQ